MVDANAAVPHTSTRGGGIGEGPARLDTLIHRMLACPPIRAVWEWIIRMESRRLYPGNDNSVMGDSFHPAPPTPTGAPLPPPEYDAALTPAAILLGAQANPGAVQIHQLVRALTIQCIQAEHLTGGEFCTGRVKEAISHEIAHRIYLTKGQLDFVVLLRSGVLRYTMGEDAHAVWVQGGYVPGGIRRNHLGQFTWVCPSPGEILGSGHSGASAATIAQLGRRCTRSHLSQGACLAPSPRVESG